MLKERIESDLKKALLERNLLEVDVLKGVKNTIQNAQIDSKSNLSEDEIVKILKKEVKKRQEAFEIYLGAGEKDRANREKEEIKIIKKYLPQEMSDKAIEVIVDKVIANNQEVPNVGQLIGLAMKEIGQGADGKKVADLVREKFKG
ncbi:GatB/YqeY domain-containing protein [Candidatus Saccharibacteria bacterium CPR2]|nr:GatB/YqeY domain-containing protein [Candidatus Saccharibacteria bacterium CPR2]